VTSGCWEAVLALGYGLMTAGVILIIHGIAEHQGRKNGKK
jgi:hypothetical protein